jgi:dTDP-4-amino-4,6-dideoxygalactose transaminase
LLENGDVVGLGKLHPAIGEAEAKLATWHGVKHCLGTSTGHGAIHAALIGLEIAAGDEVVTSPYTWGVSVSPILHNGARPVFADVDPVTGLLDPDSVEERVTSGTRAILVTHLYGQPANLTALREVADRHDVALVEDASQAHGARHAGRLVGSVGDAAGFSCMGGKLLAVAEAGFMLTPHDDVYWNAIVSTQHAGMSEIPGRAEEPGFPDRLRPFTDSMLYTYRLSTINAVLLVEQLAKLDDENAARAENLVTLRGAIAGVSSVSFPPFGDNDTPVRHILSFNFEPDTAGISRDLYLRVLAAEGLPVFTYVTRAIPHLPRMQGGSGAPRLSWTPDPGAGYADGAGELPGCDAKIARSMEMTWNYVTPALDTMRSMADAFVKVEEHLPALRDHERAAAQD